MCVHPVEFRSVYPVKFLTREEIIGISQIVISSKIKYAKRVKN